MTMPSAFGLLRIEKGQADAEEIAAITALLLLRAAAAEAERAARTRAITRCPRVPTSRRFISAHSWQA
ncbi:acyl-CoA carboxylase epsilon subunit [Streptomyces bacillaris]|uniref:acyl-CoA carboxylase epsilon subunit n=1 Tax=Streptomyces bacillaris TaxID=68179 RepID=UPI0034615B85